MCIEERFGYLKRQIFESLASNFGTSERANFGVEGLQGMKPMEMEGSRRTRTEEPKIRKGHDYIVFSEYESDVCGNDYCCLRST
jgi:hypothetical protein